MSDEQETGDSSSQQGQTVEGHQLNAGGDINVEHIGDRIDTGGGDVVQGDKVIHVYQGETAPEKPRQPFEPKTVLIPAGPFTMGDDDIPLAAPRHVVELSDFYIALFPVTNEQFAAFIRQTGGLATREMLWAGNRPPEERLRHPVTGVTWYAALDYCRWLGEETGRRYTLPSEAQWEKAARGTDGRRYPWGDVWDANRCHSEPGDFAPVDAYPVQSPYGLYDLAGNAREWTTSLWGNAPASPEPRFATAWAPDGRDDLTAPPTTRRVHRGGRGDDPAAYRCAARGSTLPDRPGPRRHRLGFRVVRLP